MDNRGDNISIKKNVIMNVLLAMSSFVVPLITFPYTSRILHPVGTGRIAFMMSFMEYFNMIALLGIPTYGIKACAKVREDKEELSRVVHELLMISLIMAVLVYVVLAAFFLCVPRLAAEKELFVIFATTVLLNAIGMEWLYQGLEQYSYITVRSLIFKLIGIVAMFALVKEEKDYIIYGAIMIFAASASNVLNFFHSGKYVHKRWLGHYNPTKHLGGIMLLFTMACATKVYTNLDSVMLGFMTTDTDVGYYNASVKIKAILVSMITALGAVLLPRSSYYLENGREDEFEKISAKALKWVIFIGLPVSVFFMIFAKEGILFLSGSLYEASILPMQIMMPTVLFIGITNVLGIQMLIPMNKEKTVLKSVIIGAVLDFIINILLIGRLRSVGAAIGTLAAELAVLIYQYLNLKDRIKRMLSGYRALNNVIAILIAVICAVWVKRLDMPPFFALVIEAVCFFTVYALFMYLRKDEIITELIGDVKDKLKGIKR
ncbi:MAG: flippase [Lachnospiraceae bacterium]|nr:flippase [Lachnospiraceae bacterium]